VDENRLPYHHPKQTTSTSLKGAQRARPFYF
jgi:hypothetical protein